MNYSGVFGGRREYRDCMQTAYIVFKVCGIYYGIETRHVKEIIEFSELKQVPELPSYIAGLLNLRGKIIQVIDTAFCLRSFSTTYTPNDQILIINGNLFNYGIIINEVIDLIELPDPKMSQLNYLSDEHAVIFPMFAGVSKYKEEVIFILDPLLIQKNTQDPKFREESRGYHRNQTLFDESFQPILQERAQRFMEAAKSSRLLTPIPIAIISLQNEIYGIEPDMIREIVNMPPLTKIPFTPPHILGFTNIRGDILAVIGIWQLMHKIEISIPSKAKILIIEIEGVKVALQVDDVLDLLNFEGADFRPVPLSVKSASAEFIKNAIRYHDEVLPILNIEKILSSAAIGSSLETDQILNSGG